ncbi:MAG: Na/Pi symporter [Gammaproteobacteria bacterium]|nr:Na/Pi symporter [Gammaproteobacteria bacterium]
MWIAIGTLAGGLGLFLLGVSMITDGLRLAAGNALRDILGRSTRTTWHGIRSGFVLSSTVQSSSAVTIATIGFVNAGLLGVHQALGIVLGATVGTTTTGWLVAAVGFQFKISTFAMPMVGIGMIMRLAGASSRLGATGEALAGFGLFFIAIDFLQTAFEGVSSSADLAGLAPEGFLGLLLYVLAGMVMTVLTQSSSATVALTLTALSGGVVDFPMAAAMVIGATVGTTSTSGLAVIGATPNARRVAAGHVCINTFSASVGIIILPAILWFSTHDSWIHDYPALAIAFFHTTLNMLGVLLMRPVLPRLSHWLEGRFVSQAEEIGRPQYLDSNVMASPTLAMDAFRLELERMAELTRIHAIDAFNNEGQPSRLLQQQHDGLRQLAHFVEQSVTRLETDRLSGAVARQLPLILRIANYIDEAVAQAHDNAATDADVEQLLKTGVREDILAFRAAVIGVIEQSDSRRTDFSAEAVEQSYQTLRAQFRALKTTLLEASVAGRIPVRCMNPAIDSLRMMLRVAERSTRIAVRLTELGGQPAAQ